jgi:hypothetical protein
MIFHFRQATYWMLAFLLGCAVTYWLPDSPHPILTTGYIHVLTGAMATSCFFAGGAWAIAGICQSIEKHTT